MIIMKNKELLKNQHMMLSRVHTVFSIIIMYVDNNILR